MTDVNQNANALFRRWAMILRRALQLYPTRIYAQAAVAARTTEFARATTQNVSNEMQASTTEDEWYGVQIHPPSSTGKSNDHISLYWSEPPKHATSVTLQLWSSRHVCLLKAPLGTKAGDWYLCSLRKDYRCSRGLIVRPHSDFRYEIIGISGVFTDDTYSWDYTQPQFEIHWHSRDALLFRLFAFVDDAVDEVLTLVPSSPPHVSFARMVDDDDPFLISEA
jgi:hypothetical protein